MSDPSPLSDPELDPGPDPEQAAFHRELFFAVNEVMERHRGMKPVLMVESVAQLLGHLISCFDERRRRGAMLLALAHIRVTADTHLQDPAP